MQIPRQRATFETFRRRASPRSSLVWRAWIVRRSALPWESVTLSPRPAGPDREIGTEALSRAQAVDVLNLLRKDVRQVLLDEDGRATSRVGFAVSAGELRRNVRPRPHGGQAIPLLHPSWAQGVGRSIPRFEMCRLAAKQYIETENSRPRGEAVSTLPILPRWFYSAIKPGLTRTWRIRRSLSAVEAGV